MMTHNTELTILSTAIRQDADGRYSLSDCWKVSGKDKNNQPSKWFEAEKTQEFLRVLGGDPENRATPVSVVTTGPNDGRGYWADRKAVIHYATWISPDFYLTVISAFDALVTGRIPEQKTRRSRAPAIDTIFARYHRIASLRPNSDPNQCWIAAGRATYEKCGENPCETLGITSMEAPDQVNHKTVTEIGKMIGLSGQAVNKALISMRYQMKVENPSSASSPYEMLANGKPHGRMYDETRKRGKGAQQVLKWSPDVAENIKCYIEVRGASDNALADGIAKKDASVPMEDAA